MDKHYKDSILTASSKNNIYLNQSNSNVTDGSRRSIRVAVDASVSSLTDPMGKDNISFATQEDRQRLSLHRDTIRRSFMIALEKIRKCVHLKGLQGDVNPPADIGDLKRDFRRAIRTLHNEIFTASGYIPWIKRNFPNDSEKIDSFRGTNLRPSRLVDTKLKDLLLRETIWTAAEHIRYCPQRINQLFYIYRQDNVVWYKTKISKIFLFGVEEEITNLNPPYLNLYGDEHKWKGVHFGIEEFRKGELNFDDINECGKWNQQQLSKTYYEPPGGSLFFLMLKYVGGTFQFKLWSFAFLVFILMFNTPLPGTTNLIGTVPAITGFVLVDYIFMLILYVNEWMVRCLVTRQKRWKNMTPLLRLRIAVNLLQLFLGAGIILAGILEFGNKDWSKWKESVAEVALYYILMRMVITVLLEFVPFSPLLNLESVLQKQKKKFLTFKGLRKRLAARVLFFLLLIALSMVYEWFLIVPTIGILFKTTYCGEPNFTFIITGYDTQQIVCIFSSIFLFFVTSLAIAIDNGLAFITAMAFVGWIRGYKTQGTARSVIQTARVDLIKHLAIRFIRNAKSNIHDVSDSKSNITIVDINEDDEKLEKQAANLWDWCCDYWRYQDLISDKEKEYLMTTTDIDCTLLGSPDAQKHISFFINTLNVAPVHNFRFQDIPPTTILIPCFTEKLVFDWTAGPNYSPQAEFRHLVAKFPHEWLNFCERLQRDYSFSNNIMEELESYVVNIQDMKKEDPRLEQNLTSWLSQHDQYVEKTVKGCCDYYYALVRLAMHQGEIAEDQAHAMAKQKLQVILCMQIYQRRYNEVHQIIARWLREFPCLQVVIDYERQEKMPEEFHNIPSRYKYATCLLEWDHQLNKVGYRYILPRENPLRIFFEEMDQKKFVQGKSVNQMNGVTFAFGRFYQVLDANQGAHSTEYLKFPALLRDFRLHPQTGDVRYRIIGSREYIFTKNLGTVARCHAYQEWSFGTLVLRTYSDLGIRLHYGHPDVFHGPWASAHAGLSKVNPDINTSEDVFAGFMTMSCQENTKHVEHIQFQKGRETGLANMTFFDTKISQGNAGILRSRDLYHLLERHDFITSFLLFQGVAGHFTTISLMMWSMKLYIILLFLVALSGASLKAFGGVVYSTEWLFHAGLTTIVPLVVEFLVEYGPVIGLLQSLFFLPVSTMIYLFQMQTKHDAFLKGILTGKASHIDTGRGLAIYRIPLINLFKNYGQTHMYPIAYVIALSIAYKVLSGDEGGGTLPLIMIYFLCASVLFSPIIFNPKIMSGNFSDDTLDMYHFLVWIGKTENRLFLSEFSSLEQQKKVNSLLSHWIGIDYDNLPLTVGAALRSLIYHLVSLTFWCAIAAFFLYPHMQFWGLFYIALWSLDVILYSIIFYFAQSYEQPLRIILIYIGSLAILLYLFIYLGDYDILDFSEMYLPFLLVVKILEQFRAFLCDASVISYHIREKKKDPADRQKYLTLMLHLINKLFFVNAGRIFLAFLWGLCCYVISILLIPFVSNVFLFGRNVNANNFTFLNPLRRIRQKQARFGIRV